MSNRCYGTDSVISPEDYSQQLLRAVRRAAPVQLKVDRCEGLVLADPVASASALPGFDNSAMDGYAVRAEDVPAGGIELPVAGCIPAGDTRINVLQAGTAWQIMTGAAVPEGADSVVQVELTDGGSEQVRFSAAASHGAAIRRAGEDVQVGDEVLAADTRIRAHHLPVLLACGRDQVAVTPAPRVAVISTGDELRSAGIPLVPGEIVDTNGPMLAALVRQAGFEVALTGRCADTSTALLDAVRSALDAGADAVVTSGGVSAGEFEPLKAAFEGGQEISFTKVAMQPGKPQGFGLLDSRTPLFALPGNPVSSLVSFVLFVAPALRVMAGRSPQARWRPATATAGWSSSRPRVQIARVQLSANDTGLTVAPSGGPGSHLMGGLAQADALAWVDPDVDEVKVGDTVRVLSLEGDFT